MYSRIIGIHVVLLCRGGMGSPPPKKTNFVFYSDKSSRSFAVIYIINVFIVNNNLWNIRSNIQF